MVNWRRAHVPGGSFFFTVVTDGRARLFASLRARNLLGSLFRRCQLRVPFTINAMVLLPEHLHAIWSLPCGDDGYSARWGWIKKEFTKHWLAGGGAERTVSAGRTHEGRRGVWQPRFWEHTLEDKHDFERHFDYIHYNPLKHRLVACPRDWPHSSFHRYVRAGVSPHNWACSNAPPLDFRDIERTIGDID